MRSQVQRIPPSSSLGVFNARPSDVVAMKYRIKNWDRYQHYRQRNPPWIKFYIDTLTSNDWVTLDDSSRVLLIACLLVASKNDGEIDGSPQGLTYLKRVAYLHKAPNLNLLIKSGFLVNASTMLADSFASKQVASSSVSEYMSLGVEEGCGEKKDQKQGKTPHGEFCNVHLTPDEFIKLGQRFGKGLAGRIENLSQYLASKGDKYKSHYATLLQWAAREKAGHNNTAPLSNGSRAHADPPPVWGKTVTAAEVWYCGCYRNDVTPCKSPDHGKTLEEVTAQ